MGVRAYSVTTAVWTRAVLIHEFGLDDSKVTWVVDDEEHVTELALPSNVMLKEHPWVAAWTSCSMRQPGRSGELRRHVAHREVGGGKQILFAPFHKSQQ